MQRILLATFLLLFVSGAAFAQSCGTRDLIAELGADDRARLDALLEPHAYAEGNLYQATKPGSTVTVIGTLHLPDPRHQNMVDRVQQDIETADLLILEATSEAQTKLQNMAAVQPEIFFITEGPTLIDLLTDEEWSALTEELKRYNIPGFMAAKFQPWFLGMTLAVPPCAIAQIQSGERGLDFMLENVAVANNIPIAELDDLDALMQMLSGDPLDKQLEGLRIWLAMKTDGDADLSTMVERYFQERAREVIEFGRLLMDERGVPVETYDEMMDAILEDRNMAWEPQIAELVEGKSVVIAVGAAHLSGESGVLRALERAGYTITRR